MLRVLYFAFIGSRFVFSSTVITSNGEMYSSRVSTQTAASIALKQQISSSPEVSSEDVPIRQEVNGSTPTGWIQVGTPPKRLYVIFDTGSDKLVAKTWDTVSNELASVDQGVDGMVLPSGSIYDHNQSTSYHRRYAWNPDSHALEPERNAITYGSGTAITDVGSDDVIVGQRSLNNFTLMEITRDSLDLLHTSKGIAGILGLQHMKNESLGHSLFSRFRDAGKMTAFGYCRGAGNNGTFIWGDNSNEGREIDVIGEMHWAVKLGSVSVQDNNTENSLVAKKGSLNARSLMSWAFGDEGNHQGAASDASSDDVQHDLVDDESDIDLDKVCADLGCTGILDTGSNIIAGPRDVMAAITGKLNVQPDCSDFDESGGSTLPPISMVFGGMPVTIQPHGYVMKVPMPEGGEEGDGDGDGDGAYSEGHSDGDSSSYTGDGDGANSAATLRTVSKHLGANEAVLAEKLASGVHADARRWKNAVNHLYKTKGIDLRELVAGLITNLQNGTGAQKFLCMPALVPLDRMTINGPLWIVGTPLLDSYYARWSFDRGATSPKIHLKALQDADVCRDAADSGEGKVNLMRRDKVALSAESKSVQRGIIERRLEDIAFPHWAKSLIKV